MYIVNFDLFASGQNKSFLVHRIEIWERPRAGLQARPKKSFPF